MEVIRGLGGHVVVYDVSEIVDVEASCGDVRGD
jgi:hypothetical protein